MLPLAYDLESLKSRWSSALVALAGIAGSVAVFVAMLALARGFQATLVRSGSPRNALALRAGASTEMYSVIDLDQVRVIEDSPDIARDADGPLASPEVVVVTNLPLRKTGTDANVQVRGGLARLFAVHESVRIVAGRTFRAGLPEVVVGRNAARMYAGLDAGGSVRFGGADWQIVGMFDAGGSAFDSEIWCDANLLNQVYLRPAGVFQSVAARLVSLESFEPLRETLLGDPRLTLQVDREVAYYDKQSRGLASVISFLGTLVAGVMGLGAVFGALNTMYSSVAERSREIATLRALGFGGGAVIVALLAEALAIAFVGGCIGCLAVLPLNGFTTGTINMQTFSHLAFAFRITPPLAAAGLGFALLMGVLGGLPPALRAARLPVAAALRDL